MSEKKKYDRTVARIAGNIAGQFVAYDPESGGYEREKHEAWIAEISVSLARAIVAEVERTEPEATT